MIKREIQEELIKLCAEYPVVTILGPRQAGKTTLARDTFKEGSYSNLESPEIRAIAESDPKTFLKNLKSPCVIDEIQRVPALLSYIQVIVDENKKNGQFILTGSHQLQLNEAISQSLAGRTAILKLLPFSIAELKSANIVYDNFGQYITQGFLPRVYDQHQRPTEAYSNYYQTYVERDVRQLINLKDINLFEKFMKLLAGRVGQLIDYNSLSNDVGVDAKTIKNWLSILEASFIVYRLTPYFENFGKRITKSPKYYFVDVGLLSFLLGIEKAEQVSRDPLVGHLFENLVVIEALKARANQGKLPNLYFYREGQENEVDLLFQNGRELIPIEIKSASTYSSHFIKSLQKMAQRSSKVAKSYVVYTGNKLILGNDIEVINYTQIRETIFCP